MLYVEGTTPPAPDTGRVFRQICYMDLRQNYKVPFYFVSTVRTLGSYLPTQDYLRGIGWQSRESSCSLAPHLPVVQSSLLLALKIWALIVTKIETLNFENSLVVARHHEWKGVQVVRLLQMFHPASFWRTQSGTATLQGKNSPWVSFHN